METSYAPVMSVVLPGPERRFEAFGDTVTFHLTGADTGGRVCMFTVETPPGSGPPPHRHEREDEWFLVLEGRVEFLRDGEWLEVPPGSAVFAAKESVHAFRNIGDRMLRMVIQTSPAGFEDFFAAAADEFHRPDGPDPQRLVEISAGFGIHYP